jgi:hypothetical protein
MDQGGGDDHRVVMSLGYDDLPTVQCTSGPDCSYAKGLTQSLREKWPQIVAMIGEKFGTKTASEAWEIFTKALSLPRKNDDPR